MKLYNFIYLVSVGVEKLFYGRTKIGRKMATEAKSVMMNSAGMKSLICFTILALACLAGFSSRDLLINGVNAMANGP